MVQFAGAGDVYLAYSVSTDPVNISVVKPGPGLSGHLISGRSIGHIRSADGGYRTMGEKHERPFRCQPLLVTPAGRLDSYYLGMASLVIP